jgi:hypothetical protein
MSLFSLSRILLNRFPNLIYVLNSYIDCYQPLLLSLLSCSPPLPNSSAVQCALPVTVTDLRLRIISLTLPLTTLSSKAPDTNLVL